MTPNIVQNLFNKKETDELSHLEQDFVWLIEVIQWRWFMTYGRPTLVKKVAHWIELDMPTLAEGTSGYQSLVKEWKLNEEERLFLLLALAPFFIPAALQDNIVNWTDSDPIEYGFGTDVEYKHYLPTGTTALFLLGGRNLEEKLATWSRLVKHPLLEKGLITVKTEKDGPIWSGTLKVDQSIVMRLANLA